jgi:hypothetical protein
MPPDEMSSDHPEDMELYHKASSRHGNTPDVCTRSSKIKPTVKYEHLRADVTDLAVIVHISEVCVVSYGGYLWAIKSGTGVKVR